MNYGRSGLDFHSKNEETPIITAQPVDDEPTEIQIQSSLAVGR